MQCVVDGAETVNGSALLRGGQDGAGLLSCLGAKTHVTSIEFSYVHAHLAYPSGVGGGFEFPFGLRYGTQEFIPAALGGYRAVANNYNFIAQALHEIQLVGREQHGRPRLGHLTQHLQGGIDRDRVQARERFVKYERDWIVYERCRDLGALLISQRQFFEIVSGALPQSEPLQNIIPLIAGIRNA